MNHFFSIQTLGLTILVFINSCIAAMLATAMPIILSDNLKASYIEVSIFIVTGAVASALIAHKIGLLTDSGKSRLKIAVFSAFAGAVGFFILAHSNNYFQFLAVFVSLIAIANSLFPQFMALAFISNPKYVPTVRAFGTLGWVIGPPIAGFSIAILGISDTFNSIVIVYLLLILLIILSVSGHLSHSRTALKISDKIEQVRDKKPSHKDLIIILSAVHFLLAIPLIAIPLRIMELEGTQVLVGLAFGLAAFIEIPIIFMARYIHNRFSQQVIWGGIGAALAVYFHLLAFSTSSYQIIAVSVLNGIITGVVMGYGLLVLQKRLPSHPGYASALYTNILRLTHVVAVLFSGIIAQYLSFRFLFIAATGLALSIVFAQKMLVKLK